jgi:septum formation protein
VVETGHQYRLAGFVVRVDLVVGDFGEPLRVAGAFTLDGLGGPFVEGVDGDPHTVVGLSLPLLRRLLVEVGVAWPSLWRAG